MDIGCRASCVRWDAASYYDADPAALYKTLALEGGSQNFSGWLDPAVTTALEASRSETDPAKRTVRTVGPTFLPSR